MTRTDPRLGIGAFAEATGLSVKALRLYDDNGLLAPAEVDPVSGYRRYDAAQVGPARLVAALRRAGMPLARVRVVLERCDADPAAGLAEVTSYARQVTADAVSVRGLLASLVDELREQHHLEVPRMNPTRPLPDTVLDVAVRRGQGARDHQLDADLVDGALLAVADGLGDAVGLSDVVLDTLAGSASLTDLDTALRDAHAVVLDRFAGHPDSGTTVTAVVVGADRVELAHVGDSRAYLVRDGELRQLTRDHSLVQSLVDSGRLTPEEARLDERRPVINRAVAVVELPPEPDLAVHAVQPGDRLVLCTDGVHAVLDAVTLADLLIATDSAEVIADAVAGAVEAAGAPDNWSVLVADLGSGG